MEQRLITSFNDLKNIPKGAPIQLYQQRGRDFENLINDVMESEGTLLRRSYHTTDNRSEQIDGAIEVYHRVFLLETKWVESNLAASDLYAFIGKTDNKFHGTLGVFISKEELSSNFINALNKGRRQSIMVIHGDDLEQLFQPNAPTFKDYLEFCFKKLSYDNTTHFPVKDFLPIVSSRTASAIPANTIALKTFVDKLNSNVRISSADMLLELAILPADVLGTTFGFVISNYRTLYYRAILDKKHQTIDNLTEFIRLADPQQASMLSTASVYFTKFLFSELFIFGSSLLLDKFCPYYKALSDDDKNKFETILLNTYKEQFGNWDIENKLTELVGRIWAELSSPTTDDLYSYYIQFFLSDSRREKFPQKQFAIQLLNNKISLNFLETWLNSQIEQARAAYDGEISDEAKARIAITYHPLNQFLKKDDWRTFIFDSLN